MRSDRQKEIAAVVSRLRLVCRELSLQVSDAVLEECANMILQVNNAEAFRSGPESRCVN